ncbi:hypothetical protein C8J57DRAFT_1291946 [Mycena rebaudengoi]|nr:hypothetical protein C8J57DRAFT_1291946 [Mycena rebaudengoi]
MSSTLQHPKPRFNDQLVNAFIGLQLAGGLGMVLIVLTALASHTQESPSFGPCLAQGAAIYSAPSLCMLFGMRAAFENKQPKRRLAITLALLIGPFVVWLSVFFGMLAFALNNPSLVEKGQNGTYCNLASFTPGRISGLVVVSATTCILIIEGYIGICLFRNRTLLRSGPTTRMALRVIIFSLIGALCLGVGVAYVLYSKQGPVFDIILASIPVSGVLIFGSQAVRISLLFIRGLACLIPPSGSTPGLAILA